MELLSKDLHEVVLVTCAKKQDVYLTSVCTLYSHKLSVSSCSNYPIPPLGEWDFVVWLRVHSYYYSLPCSKQWLISHKIFKLSQ